MWGKAMPTHLILKGREPVEVVLRQSSRARRLSLRVSALDGRVTLTMPAGLRLREAEAFLAEKADWVRAALVQHPEGVTVGVGATVLFQGAERRIEAAPVRAVKPDGDRLLIPAKAADAAAPRVLAFLKLQARQNLQAATDLYATRLGRPYGRMTLRDTRSRWGSCSTEGNLNYSWRLIMAPPKVLEYVAAHEVAHLAEMNHSPAFWSVVERIHGPYQAPRKWLRSHGAELHRYRFGD